MKSDNTKLVRHPYTQDKITLSQYFAEFGGKYEKVWEGKTRPAPLCHVCRGKLVTRGDERPVHTITVAHWPDDQWRCPLKNQVDKAYELLANGTKDKNRGIALRSAFMNEWWHHYNMINMHVGNAYDIKDLISRVMLADQTDLWSRAQLQLWEIPYIFMVWRAFEPVHNTRANTYLRDHWIRFWLDPSYRAIDDIWIRASSEIRLIKTKYSIPIRKVLPSENELIGDAEDIFVSEWQLSVATNRWLHSFKVSTFVAQFPEAVMPN
jgi:hypothetical protein